MFKDIRALQDVAWEIRKDMLEVLRTKESHHIGCSFSIVELVTLLYFKVLKINPKKPYMPERDIFILSKGHAALAIYATLCKKGFYPRRILNTYDQDGGRLPEHISTAVPGIEFSSGSLGHGLSVGAGFATSYLNDKKNNQVYVLMSDGEFNEGSNWEAIMFAGHHKLRNLTALVDLNGFQGYAPTKKVIDLSPLSEKIKNFGWQVEECNGHDFKELFAKIKKLEKSKKPKMLIAKTVKGKGIPYFEGKFESHYLSVPDDKTKLEIIADFLKTK